MKPATETEPMSANQTPIRSTWRDPVGKPLDDKAIAQYARDGWYGKDEQQRQMAEDAACLVNGRWQAARPCACGKLGKWLTFSYLPHAGWYCTACREHYRAEAEAREWERNKYNRLETFE